jgi:hypothetical protein
MMVRLEQRFILMSKREVLEFRKSLARYYKKWYQDSLDSAEYCENHGDLRNAEGYRISAERYLKIIEKNREAIEFFSIGDNAHLIDSALPEKFRGYK